MNSFGKSIRLVFNRRWKPNQIVLYDAGGWFVFLIYLGVPAVFGLVIDYFWNFLILHLSLKWVGVKANTGKKAFVCVLITCLGLVIDWFYYMFMWGGGLFFPPPLFDDWGARPVIEVLSILIPMALLSVEYYSLDRFYFRTSPKQAIIAGLIMGILTSPWLILGFVFLRGGGRL